MQKVKVITNYLKSEFEKELNIVVQKENIKIHQINYQAFLDRNRIIHSVLIIYTEIEEGNQNGKND